MHIVYTKNNNSASSNKAAHAIIRYPISLRLLALILCSNCSSVVNTALATIGGHLLTYFLSLGGPLELAQCPPRMVMAFHAPP